MSRCLLMSGGLSTPERRDAAKQALHAFLGDVSRVVFVPYALADHEGYTQGLAAAGFMGDIELVGLHTYDDRRQAVREAECVFVGGGNTFRLLDHMQREQLLDPIRERVAAGMPYIGISAGTNLACPTIQTTNDMPIVHPDGFEGLGLVPFQINAHYFSGRTWIQREEDYIAYGGETRDDRLREFHEMNTRPIIALWEGAWLEREGKRLTLGGGGARLFRPGQEPEDLEAGAQVDEWLRGTPTL